MQVRANSRVDGPFLLELFTVTVGTLLLLFTVISILLVVVSRHNVGTRDFIEYWGSGQQLVHHRNPYSASELATIEHSEGLPHDLPALVMGNAPPALLLVYPLGFFNAKTAQCMWLLLMVAALVTSINFLTAATETKSTFLPKLLGVTFGPVLVCIPSGQMALFVLLGAAMFIRFYRTRPLLAGAALWLCLLKPHLFLPFGVVLCVWIWQTKRFRVLAGAILMVASTAVTISVLDPDCWTQYRQMMLTLRYDKAVIPCLSMVLRDSAPGVPFLQYWPAAIGCVWALAYYWRNRAVWDWLQHGSLVLLVSLLVAPYTWFVDQCLALPALLRGVTLTRSRVLICALALATVLIELGPLLGYELLHSRSYLWAPPFYLVWYLAATRRRSYAADNLIAPPELVRPEQA